MNCHSLEAEGAGHLSRCAGRGYVGCKFIDSRQASLDKRARMTST